MKKKNEALKTFLFWFLFILIAGVFTITYFISNGNKTEEFNDILLGNSASFDGNITFESRLIYFLIFAGSAVVLIHGFLKRKSHSEIQVQNKRNVISDDLMFFLCAICMTAGYSYIINQNIIPQLVVAILLAVIILCIDRSLILSGLVLYFISYYGYFAIYRYLVFCGLESNINVMMLSSSALITSFVPLVFSDRNKAFIRASMIFQIPIPALLLSLLQSKYMYQGNIITIDVPIAVKIFVVALIAILLLLAVINIYKNWANSDSVQSSICIGTCIAIIVFNQISSVYDYFLHFDMHHWFEEVIGYSQIFELGQVPFQEYVPVSGMYSVLVGFIFKVFGGGIYSNYAAASGVFYSLCTALTVLLMRPHFKKIFIFVICLFVSMPFYSRYVFVVPIVLLLLNKKLMQNKNRWLKVYLLSSLVNGLYYPLYGVAVCLGFLPFAIRQVITYIRSVECKKDIKNPKFWMCWGLCLVPVLLCIPLILGTLKHMLAMATQSRVYESYPLFGRLVFDNFLTYLDENSTFRTILFYLITFLTPCILVWVGVELMARVVKTHHSNIKNVCLSFIREETLINMFVPISIIVVLTYYSTRMGEGIMEFRAFSAYIAGIFTILVIVLRSKKRRWLSCKWIIFSMLFIVVAMCGCIGITSNYNSLTYKQDVPDDYVFVQNHKVEKLGKCFMPFDYYRDIEATSEIADNLDKDKSYFGKLWWFGHYYLYDIKGDDTIEIYTTVASYNAAQEAVDITRENRSCVGTAFETIRNYYFYNWLLTSGEYIWSDKDQMFIYNDGEMTPDEVRANNKALSFGEDGSARGQFASAWGSSMDTLEDIFSNPGVTLTPANNGLSAELLFSETIDGDDADFLYIDFPNMEHEIHNVMYDRFGEIEWKDNLMFTKQRYNPGKYVVVTWSNDDGTGFSMRCEIGKGKLLIPLGAGKKWLLYNHDHLTVTVEKDGQQETVPDIGSVRLLKLREVG